MTDTTRTAKRQACPHIEIKDCPLYIASHEPKGLGCVKDILSECDVTTGKMEYGKAVRRLNRATA